MTITVELVYSETQLLAKLQDGSIYISGLLHHLTMNYALVLFELSTEMPL